MASSLTGQVDPLSQYQNLFPKTGKPRTIGNLDSFIISALSPAGNFFSLKRVLFLTLPNFNYSLTTGAVVFTNPFDTAKVRLQLQIKPNKKDVGNVNNNQIVYKNSLDTIQKIYKNEGLKGLQKGLIPAILRESSKNFFRIGMYDPIMGIIHDSKTGSAPAWKRLVAGSMCGVMGAFSCNPFELVKTRLQSASAGKITVGHQHNYTGTWHALKCIVRDEGFFKGLYRGSVLSMCRSVVGSGTNLASFTMMKEYLMLNQGWRDSKTLDIVCGLGSAVISVMFMNPIDVVRTRYYNQPYDSNSKGKLYSSGFDAITKIAKAEGPTAFYKGLVTHFFRIGPHFCFTFLFLGILRRQLNEYYGYLDRKDSFLFFDANNDGALNLSECENLLNGVFFNDKEKVI
ncbi:hypothetical protein HDU92_007275 [Lobulomyces angularis]|nr:hypothetical protein HDU92_007275 [Lobulomyces angularis]